ncbi:C-GCAxxG-C-C family protein [Desulforamulus hydrothermalis]|uniref:C_GCAxxG_C_C family protein n=1 Tax=Desulforamulus hydrothermalis Lam5 = DSM 18033 TaxID=1121428 RepID=K8EGX1_9FIRM|nr:C-GCAxxG-C-C family protein [Desulforamulus hydrothermalis]CCO07866.1 C_GCAxxG_C_C family protein [Desulforamulus hydrothermalis Lam5 = DSM 18033]SHH27962.1 C_GCAxxG_C_C family probable redox protein [Desulforamulus hydrothermalis Lam5 = DSM 18033]
MNQVEKAVKLFEEGYLCSQAILATYGPEFGISRETALKLSAPFGGGVARMAETCGAVNGAFMVLGLKYGHTEARDGQTKEKAYAIVKEFVNEFEAKNGTITCKELLNCDISNNDELKRAREEKLFTTICPKLVKDAAEILDRILKDK